MADIGETKYVLINTNSDESATFETEEEIEEFLKDEDYDENMLEDVRVFKVDTEYTVSMDQTFELEEV